MTYLVQDFDSDLFGTRFRWLLVLVQDSDGYLFGTGLVTTSDSDSLYYL